jgi:hypothetical protein
MMGDASVQRQVGFDGDNVYRKTPMIQRQGEA